VTPVPIAEGRRRVELALATAVFVAAIGVAVLRVTGLPEVHRVRLGAAQWAFDDFKLILYYPARALLDGANPYDAPRYLAAYRAVEVPMAPYAPVSLVAGIPFALLPFAAAAWVHFALTVVLTAALVAAAFRLCRITPSPAVLVAATGIVLLSRPGHWNLLLGQVTVPLVLGTYAALAYARLGPLPAAAGFAVATVKPTFGIPLALLLLARRDPRARRVVLLGIALTAAINLPVLAVLARRAGGVMPLVAQAREGNDMLFRHGNRAITSIGRIDLAALITRPLGTDVGQTAEAVIGLALLAIAALVLRRLEARGETADAPRSVAVACGAILLGMYHQGYDVLLMVAPAVALAYRLVAADAGGRAARLAALGLLAVLALNFITTESGVAALEPGRAAWVLVTSINAGALLAVFAIVTVAAMRAPAAADGSAASGAARSQNPVAR
jgi:hypothetical protein